MNAIEEFKQKIMESDRGERQAYQNAAPDDEVKVPITRDGFEAFLEYACKFMDLPVTNPLRNVLVGFLHHIDKEVCMTTLRKAGAALHKSMSNQTTWEIDNEVKKVANEEMRVEREKQAKALEEIEKEKKIKSAQEKREAKEAKRNGKKTSLAKRNSDETAENPVN